MSAEQPVGQRSGTPVGQRSGPPVGQRFSTVLVANRGEIALRVLRAVKAAGLRSVAVYSDADRDVPHVRAADIAVCIGPAPAAESYLSIPKLLEAARSSGADAVHPGYGFLSERSAFARAVVDAGMVFIGPPADVMDAMGRKDRAREIAVAAGVPVIPAADLAVVVTSATRMTGAEMAGAEMTGEGSDSHVAGATPHVDLSVVEIEAIGQQVGFPLMVKAAAGGGGKGMRIVREPHSLPDAVLAAKREALAAFGDDTMLFERYVDHGRHIEVQILADEHGHVVHLHERDCSVQRRHQKVLEEAPAIAVSDSVRQLVLSSAVALAKEVGYVNAGTVEFLVRGEEAFFLEMNTRLQVEHPVTELVTGLDLVALQLAVAQGDRLPFLQDEIVIRGHAIEARVYAEDARHGFLPQAGTATLVQWPQGVRVDAALQSGQQVSTHYDPLLGKVIAWAANREVARHTLVAALDRTTILGLTTNIGFVRDLADSDVFRDGDIDTAWLDSQPPQASAPSTPDEAWCMAAWSTAESLAARGDGPFDATDGWRNAGPSVPILLPLSQEARGLSTVGGESRAASDNLVSAASSAADHPVGAIRAVNALNGGGTADVVSLVSVDLQAGVVTIGSVRHDVRKLIVGAADPTTAADPIGFDPTTGFDPTIGFDPTTGADPTAANERAADGTVPGNLGDLAKVQHLEIDGVRRRGLVWSGPQSQVVVAYHGHNHVFQLGDDLVGHGAAVGDGSVLAPMPGTLLTVDVRLGEAVLEGDTLAVMEAMKMELSLKAPSSGVVIEVNTKVGAQVDLGATLFKVSPIAGLA